MARLEGDLGGDRCSFELTAIRPTPDGSKNAYHLALQDADSTFAHIYDDPGEDEEVLSHYWVFRIAYIFQKASRLLRDTYEFRLTRSTRTDKKDAISLQASSGWLHVTLEPKILAAGNKSFSHVYVQVYAQTDFESNENGRLPQFVRLVFLCTPEDAEAFGHALQKELDEAEVLRESFYVAQEDSNEMQVKE
jgi:hypothetical protein